MTPFVATVVVAAGASTAVAGVPGQGSALYTSPTGSGNSCSSFRPCSLTTAQSQARMAARTGVNVTVLLGGGTYQLSSPLNFTSADSGPYGHRVTYQAVTGQTPILSGGRTITGWTQYPAATNVWVASVPGIAPTRQLYVNGKRASLALAPAASVLGTLTPTSSGYQTSQSPKLSSWTGTADQPDVMYPGVPLPWEQSLCGISAISGTSVTMANPCFQNLTTPMAGYTVASSVLSAPGAYVENNLALLTQPGQFYVDTHDGKVFYMPRAGERMSAATVVAPQLTSLVTATDVANLTISGVTFAYATWLPSATQGFVDVQSNLYDTSSNANWGMIPSAVSVITGNKVVFTGNTLTHLGGAGVGFDAGGIGNTVSGNVVADVSASGISLSSPLAAPESGDQVTDNYLHHVALEYQGGAGIFAGIVAHTTISHNEIWAVPSIGISLGWGWGSSSMTDNHVDYNRVHDLNQSSLSDGGAIYLNGAESGAALSSSVVGNYISGDPQPFGAIYLEAGASNYNVSSNVITHTSTNWIYLQTQQYGSPAVNNSISGNYTDTPASTECSVISTTCSATATVDLSNILSNNITGLTSLLSIPSTILASAGLELGYASITHGTVDTNLSYGATATASSTDASSQPASAASDGDSTTAWTSAVGDSSAVWQTDLGSPRTLSELQALTNQGSDLPSSRSNVKLVVSNSPITATSTGTTACTVASPGVAFQGTIDCPAPTGTWRYVGIIATGGQQLSLAEFRAFGH